MTLSAQRFQRQGPALVLAHSRSLRGLWDPQGSELEEHVETLLGDVFVTSASLTGSGPGLTDALAAARFMGCPAAVVAMLEDADGELVLHPILTHSPLPLTAIRCKADAEQAAAAYRLAVGQIPAPAAIA